MTVIPMTNAALDLFHAASGFTATSLSVSLRSGVCFLILLWAVLCLIATLKQALAPDTQRGLDDIGGRILRILLCVTALMGIVWIG